MSRPSINEGKPHLAHLILAMCLPVLVGWTILIKPVAAKYKLMIGLAMAVELAFWASSLSELAELPRMLRMLKSF